MAEPGLAQIIHYSRWLANDGIGLGGALLSVVGAALLCTKKPRQAVIFGLFPILFFALMCAQRANFVRNMIPIIPYCAVFASYFIAFLLEKYLDRAVLFIFYGALTALIVCEPLLAITRMRSDIQTFTDSRVLFEQWVGAHPEREIAVIGNLEVQPSLRARNGVTLVDTRIPLDELYEDGFEFLALPAYVPPPNGQLATIEMVHNISGAPEDQRVPKSPAIRIYEIKRKNDSSAQLSILPVPLGAPLGIDPEPYTWITKKASLLAFDITPTKESEISLQLTVMSPWKDQQIELIGKNWRQAILLNQKNPGEWIPVPVRVPLKAFLTGNQLELVVAKVSSPASHGMNNDSRRLGIALQRIDRLEVK